MSVAEGFSRDTLLDSIGKYYNYLLMVDREWVEKIARLARLSLSEEEISLFQRQLGDILHFVEQLSELDTSEVEPYIQKTEATPMREDRAGVSLSQEEALMNAPQREKGFFVVPRIVEV